MALLPWWKFLLIMLVFLEEEKQLISAQSRYKNRPSDLQEPHTNFLHLPNSRQIFHNSTTMASKQILIIAIAMVLVSLAASAPEDKPAPGHDLAKKAAYQEAAKYLRYLLGDQGNVL